MQGLNECHEWLPLDQESQMWLNCCHLQNQCDGGALLSTLLHDPDPDHTTVPTETPVLQMHQARPRTTILDHCMKHSKNSPIPVWMFPVPIAFIFIQECHEVGMGPWVQWILHLSQVICSVIDMKNLVLVDTVVCKCEMVPFLRSKVWLIPIKITPK